MHGLPIGKLILTEYDDLWPQAYECEAKEISKKVGHLTSDIQHIGSTSVPGMLAKPIIDIGLTIDSSDSVEQMVTPLTDLGYEYRGLHTDNEPGHYYLIKNNNGLRLFHLHVFIVPSNKWDRHLLFRDNLKRFPELAAKYAAKKREWAEAANWNKLQYSLSKDDFVAEVLAI